MNGKQGLKRSPAQPLQHGRVAVLNPGAGFGYVRDDSGSHQYIFVYGGPIKRSLAGALSVGSSVAFRLGGDGRVEELVPA